MDDTGAYAWPAGRRLARDLAAVVDCRGRTVCDLGCGQGALGRAALAAGAARVVFLDGDPAALESARAACNDPRAEFHPQRWGEPVPVAPCDLVLGGDVLYRPPFFAALLASVAAALAPEGEALLSDPRQQLEDELLPLAAAAGLTWSTERRADYTLVRCRLIV